MCESSLRVYDVTDKVEVELRAVVITPLENPEEVRTSTSGLPKNKKPVIFFPLQYRQVSTREE